jgi:Ca2+-binding EF-hand superfamily protein
MLHKRTRTSALRWALASALAVGGCSTGGNPFAKTNDFDRTFISAAQTWDLDKNGTVTCDEWGQYISTSFREADTNGDGALDADEWKVLVKSDRLFEIANISYYDANGDGRVSLEEMTGKQNAAFKLLDRNGDCQIDRTETVQVRGVDAPKPKDSSATDTSGRGPGGR